MQLWATALQALKITDNTVHAACAAHLLLADSEDEALGKARQAALTVFPVLSGYGHHNVSVASYDVEIEGAPEGFRLVLEPNTELGERER